MNIYDWSRFDEEQLPDKSAFYSNLNMDEISVYRHAKNFFDKFDIKHLGEYNFYMFRVIRYY